MKFALVDLTSGEVRQWQDHDLHNYAPSDPEELHPLRDDFEFPDGPMWVRDGELTSVAPIPPEPVTPTHAELVEQAKAAIRVQRQPIIGILDGLQTSALVKGESQIALAIETAKQGLRDLTDLDLSGCSAYEEMRAAVKARYVQLAASLPTDVRAAFSEAVS